METFLHQRCKVGMCQDCIDIANEYQELEIMRKLAMINRDLEIEKLNCELIMVKRRAEMYEACAKAGVGDVISAWMDYEIGKILEKGECDGKHN